MKNKASYFVKKSRCHFVNFLQGSVELRVFASLFYDYGKRLADSCPYPLNLQHKQTREFFDQNVVSCLNTFPNLKGCDTAFIPHVNHKISLEAYAKKSAKSGFALKVKKHAEQRQQSALT